jgi:hypothetical protein
VKQVVQNMTLAIFPSAKKSDAAGEQEKREILEGMRQTREDLRAARDSFNNAREPELVEAAVFQINALQSRYAYYLRVAKELQCETTASAAVRPSDPARHRQAAET